MIKIKALKKMVNELGFKLSASTATVEIDNIIMKVIELACEQAGKQASSKLEGRHFKGIKPYKVENSLENRLSGLKIVRKKLGKGKV